ncbi:hypothetical protein DDR33_11680 [Pararcticibacter amylolyticus]|uniref:Uncharacterized protein n=1 Tax=Pararcticibacter amylolyticus TaxID=2173175 RepID=A0A2U2PH07_9SPHI|nr:hypothetical protein DDR33_11680 [Pararcticibacter amylolyticus]
MTFFYTELDLTAVATGFLLCRTFLYLESEYCESALAGVFAFHSICLLFYTKESQKLPGRTGCEKCEKQ